MLNLLPSDLGMTANSYARASAPMQPEAGLFRATKNLVLNQLLIHFAIISNPWLERDLCRIKPELGVLPCFSLLPNPRR